MSIENETAGETARQMYLVRKTSKATNQMEEDVFPKSVIMDLMEVWLDLYHSIYITRVSK